MKAFKRGEGLQRPELKEMFTDVYGGEEPWNIVSMIGPWWRTVWLTHSQTEQREELKTLLKKYGNSWEPWKAELKKYKGEGKEFLS